MYDSILKMIESSKLGINQIAENSGVQSRWLRMVVDGDIKEPGFSKMEKVRKYLSKDK